MQKITRTQDNAANGLGTLLLRKLMRSAVDDLGDFAKALSSTTTPPRLAPPRVGLYAPMFDATQAQRIAKAATSTPKPLTTAGKKPTPLDTSGQQLVRRDDLDLDDPSHAHTLELRRTAAAREALLESFRVAYRGPVTHQSSGPDPRPTPL